MTTNDALLYPDNGNRDARARDLAAQCAEFQAKAAQAKDDLEQAAAEASSAMYDATRKIEPSLPPFEDWKSKVTLAEQVDFGSFTAPQWVLSAPPALASLVASLKATSALNNYLKTANLSKAAVTEAAEAGKAAAAAGEEAVAAAERGVVDEASAGLLEAAEVEVSETMLQVVSRSVLSVVGGAVAGAAVMIVTELITEAIDGAKRRDQYRQLIKDTFKARQQYKFLDMQYEALKEAVLSCSEAYSALTDGDLGDYTKDQLEHLATNLLKKATAKQTGITPEAAAAALADLDRRDGAWTNEDTLGA